MFDVNDDAKGEFRRVEVLTGPVRRRRWSAEEKARIVEETLAPSARVSEVARRWHVCSQQVFTWRRAAYRAASSASTVPDFVPIMAETASSASVVRSEPTPPAIEIKLAGAVVRVVSGMDDATQLTAVLRAVRASASRT
jgi:transposase